MMDAARAEIWLECLTQAHLDQLLGAGITTQTILRPSVVMATRGQRAHDGRFDYRQRAKPDWLAFEEAEDFVFCPVDRLGDEAPPFATAEGRAFALGEDNIWNPGTYALDGWLSVWPSPLAWLQAGRRGIVIVDWDRVFECLRDCPRILGETVILAERIDTLMHPARLPAISVRQKQRSSRRAT
jgi:hypothetical protein